MNIKRLAHATLWANILFARKVLEEKNFEELGRILRGCYNSLSWLENIPEEEKIERAVNQIQKNLSLERIFRRLTDIMIDRQYFAVWMYLFALDKMYFLGSEFLLWHILKRRR